MSDGQRQLETYINDMRPRYEDMLGQAVEIPSISMDPGMRRMYRMAELAAQYLQGCGRRGTSSRPRVSGRVGRMDDRPHHIPPSRSTITWMSSRPRSLNGSRLHLPSE